MLGLLFTTRNKTERIWPVIFTLIMIDGLVLRLSGMVVDDPKYLLIVPFEGVVAHFVSLYITVPIADSIERSIHKGFRWFN